MCTLARGCFMGISWLKCSYLFRFAFYFLSLCFLLLLLKGDCRSLGRFRGRVRFRRCLLRLLIQLSSFFLSVKVKQVMVYIFTHNQVLLACDSIKVLLVFTQLIRHTLAASRHQRKKKYLMTIKLVACPTRIIPFYTLSIKQATNQPTKRIGNTLNKVQQKIDLQLIYFLFIAAAAADLSD